MSFSSNFLNLIIDANCDLSIKSRYLDDGRHFHYFSSLDNKQVEQIKQKINSSLSLHNKRIEGFVLLNKYLNECSHLLILSESVSWATACLQSSTTKNAYEKQLSFICLSKIFNAASNSPEIYRMLSGTVVPQFVDLLSQMKLENCDLKTMSEFCRCFEICLKTFKGPFSSRRKVVEDFIIGLSKSTNFQLLARSFALLAFTGSNKQLHTNNNFNHLMIMSIFTLDKLMDANLNETHQLQYYANIKEQPLLSLNTQVARMEKTLDFANKFKFLCSVVQHLLDEPFEGVVKVPIALILNFIQRIVSLKINRTHTTANLESILNLNIIPTLHTSALSLLDQLITTCSTNLSTNLKEINKILLDLFENLDKQDKCYLIEIKSLWYKVICNWFNRLGNHLTVIVSKQWTELIVENFFADIQVKKIGLQLQNKKHVSNERSANNKFSEHSFYTDEELALCLKACQTLDSLLINFSKFINSKQFHEFVYQLLIIVQDLYRVELWRKSTYFIDSNLRLSLLRVFRTCLILFTNTTLLNSAIVLLNTIIKLDKSSDIQKFAKETLIIINTPKTKVYLSTQHVDDLMNSQVNVLLTGESSLSNVSHKMSEPPVSNGDLNTDKTAQSECISSDSCAAQDDLLQVKEPTDKNQPADNFENLSRSESSFEQFKPNNSNLTKTVPNSDDKKVDRPEEQLTEQTTARLEKDEIEVLKANDTNVQADELVEGNICQVTSDNITSPKRITRSKKLAGEEVVTARLTRSVKKKLEESEQQSVKKPRIEQNENLLHNQTISEEKDLEVEEILKDFVDV